MASAISGYINTIRNAIYGEQVRGAIINALEACYSDVENPDLQSAAFLDAIEQAYADGVLDITEVTRVNQMTNENIIYRYMGTEAGYTANTLYFHNGTAWVPIGSGIRTASTAAMMTDTGAIYKYTGTESGYTQNALYFHNGTSWEKIASGDTDVGTDTTMSTAGLPADAKAVGNYFGTQLVNAYNTINAIEYGNGWFSPNGTITADNQYRYTVDYLPISILQMAVAFEFHTQYISCCVYYDSEKAVVGAEATGAGSGYFLRSVTIPDGAVYFRVSQNKKYIDPFPVILPSLSSVAMQPIATNGIPASGIIEPTDQGGLTTSGANGGFKDWKISPYIKVVPNTVLEYGGCGNIGGNATLVPIAFYDADKNFISCVLPDKSDYVHIYQAGWKNAPSSGPSMNAGRVVVPKNATYCRVCGIYQMKPYLNYAHENNWMGKRCVFFGDSITIGVGTTGRYADFLAMFKGIIVENYAVNGSSLVTNGMERVETFASDYADADDPDAFFFAYGTNDFSGQKPIGDWYTLASDGTRTLTTDTTTFKGVLANIVTYIKTNYDGAKIILMTPLRRGAGSYASDLKPVNGKYLSDFVDAIKEAKDVLGVDVIDLYGESGLNPNINPSTKYFTPNDRLHPNVEGHFQIAKVISAKLNSISP